MNPHLAAGRMLYGAPLDAAAIVVVAVHGRGQNPAYLIENLIEPLERTDLAWLLPAADGDSWYPQRFMAPIADNEPSLSHALDAMTAVEAEVTQPIVWAGFSQGACLVAEYVARRDGRTPAGLVCLTGGMIGPPETVLTVAGSLKGMPAYFSNSEADEWVPLSRTEATVEAFRTARAQVDLEVVPGREHVISATEIDSVGRFLRHIAG